eukprot:153953-Amphidinium_carterae.1
MCRARLKTAPTASHSTSLSLRHRCTDESNGDATPFPILTALVKGHTNLCVERHWPASYDKQQRTGITSNNLLNFTATIAVTIYSCGENDYNCNS